MKSILLVLLAAFLAVGCGRIQTGEVGVRTNFNKTIDTSEVPPGFYGALLTSVDHFDVRETEIQFNDLKPKAKDNLSLHDIDVSVFYKVKQDMVADLIIKYSGMSNWNPNAHAWMPAFSLIERIGRGAIYDMVSQYESLTIHNKRNELEAVIMKRLQEDLDRTDKDVFQVTKVVVRNLLTDPALEKAIQDSVRVEKEVQARRQQVDLARAEAERKRVEAEGEARANQIIAASITPQLIELRRIEAMQHFAGNGTHTVIMPSNTGALVNVGK